MNNDIMSSVHGFGHNECMDLAERRLFACMNESEKEYLLQELTDRNGLCYPSGITGQFLPCTDNCQQAQRTIIGRRTLQRIRRGNYNLKSINATLEKDDQLRATTINDGVLTILDLHAQNVRCGNGFTD